MNSLAFIIPCHNMWDNGYIVPCIESIQKYNPDAKILVVDSNSPNRSYMSKIDCEILDIGNKNYDFAAYWKGFDHIKADNYMMLHDSCLLRAEVKLEDYHNKPFTPLYWFPSNNNCYETLTWSRKLAKDKCGYDYEHFDSRTETCIYAGIFGTTREYLESLKADKFDECLPSCKIEAVYTGEYLWALAAYNKGISIRDVSFYGRFPDNPNTPDKMIHKFSAHVEQGRS
jgi:hypothetical protein